MNKQTPPTNQPATTADVDALLDHLTLESDAPAELRRRVASDPVAARDLDELREVAARLAELPADWPDVTDAVLDRAGFKPRRAPLLARVAPVLLPLAAAAVLALAATPLLLSALRDQDPRTPESAGPLLAVNTEPPAANTLERIPDAPPVEAALELPPIDANVLVARPADDVTPSRAGRTATASTLAVTGASSQAFASLAAGDLFGVQTEFDPNLGTGLTLAEVMPLEPTFEPTLAASAVGMWQTRPPQASWTTGPATGTFATQAGFAAVLPITDELEEIARASARFAPRYNAPFGQPLRPVFPTATVLPAPYLTEDELNRLLEAVPAPSTP